MSDIQLSEYVSRTRDYLASPAGRRAWRENHLAHGYSAQANLCAAIMTATHLVRYDRIDAVAKAIEVVEAVA